MHSSVSIETIDVVFNHSAEAFVGIGIDDLVDVVTIAMFGIETGARRLV